MENRNSEAAEENILVLAPLGRDAELAASALRDAGMQAEVCGSLRELIDRLQAPSGVLLMAEEGLEPSLMPRLSAFLEQQPAWSDIPIVLLTGGGSVTQESRTAVHLFGPAANVTLLERPIRVITLTATLQVALRARRRQFEVRDLLRQREQVLASIHDAFVMLDREWCYTYVNEQAAQLCGKSPTEMLGRSLWDLFPGLAGTPVEENLRRAMKDRARVAFEWLNPRWERWFNIRVYPSEDGISLLTTETTEQKKLESVIAESERRLHLALDSSQLGMFYCDLPFDKIVWDANCKKHFGLAPDAEVDFALFYSLLHPEDRERTRAAIEHAVAEHTSYDVEYRAVHPDGSIRWIHAIGRAFYNEAGEPTRFDGITIDISDRKQAELELERARREAVEANQAKDHFLAALSHELRTPLTPVLMTVAALQQDETVPDSVRAELSGIHRHVELEARLIDDLLDLTRVTRGKLVLHRNVVDVNELLEHAVETCCGEDIAHRRMKISVRPEAREHHTFGDPARLHQVMCNLLNNALKFTPDGGTIELISSNPQPGTIGICVADSGMGITAELLPRLFDAFEQGNPAVTRRFGGLGLGLAISKAIVDLHGGTLRAESDGKGRGAKFTLELEAVAAPQAEETTSAPHLPLFTQPLRILLTEDHEATRAILTRLLTRAGHHVRAAGNVSDALALAAQHTFDLLVSDLGLPDGHGSDLMRELRDRYGLRGIALSGYGMEEDVRESAAAGFALHLTKPVEWRRLEAALSTFGSEMTSAPQPMAVQ